MKREKNLKRRVYGVNQSQTIKGKLGYALFLVPIFLALLSWVYFPVFAQTIITEVFRYSANAEAASIFWLAPITFFYTWYTFLAIGIAGIWITASILARRKRATSKQEFYPMISFIVPAFNEEENVKHCLASLLECTDHYDGNCEIIVVDDGSKDATYEAAWSTVKSLRQDYPRVRCKISRHMTNLGKIEALRTGVNCALGQILAVVDADSKWNPKTLKILVDSMFLEGRKAVTGYIHPESESEKNRFIVSLQQLEYSQGLGIDRCGQSLFNCVLVIPGAIGVYDSSLLRDVLTEVNIRSVTEDSEITLEMHKRGARIGYNYGASGGTNAPKDMRMLWHQRLRWFTGWLHNVLDIHVDLFNNRSWLSTLLWYSLVFEFFGAFVDLAALAAFPFLFWFAPDRLNFAFNLLVFTVYGLLINIFTQAVALKFAYGKVNYYNLLFYTPFFTFLWLINVFARVQSVFGYLGGSRGKWHHEKKAKS